MRRVGEEVGRVEARRAERRGEERRGFEAVLRRRSGEEGGGASGIGVGMGIGSGKGIGTGMGAGIGAGVRARAGAGARAGAVIGGAERDGAVEGGDGLAALAAAEHGEADGGAPGFDRDRGQGEAAGGAEVPGLFAVGGAWPAAPGLAPAREAAEAGRARLAAAVRALPPAVEVFRAAGREVLSLDFGRTLKVELRQREGGVELALAAAAALAPAARAELPGLLRALVARGVPVVKAEVRQRGGAPERR